MYTEDRDNTREDHLELSYIQKNFRKETKFSYKRLEISTTQESFGITDKLIIKAKGGLYFLE